MASRAIALGYACNFRYHTHVNATQRKTLAALFARPTRGDVRWPDIEVLFRSLGADISEGAGSRVRVALNGVRAIFHRPHPQKEVKKYAVESVRDFLKEAGIRPD
ncbi:MAG: type II toxin-antitoxin system HicA family toxin [Rhodospirillales bacterium]|nr:type II toxin-antitoxin system HicA family toxin [Rhodospirillales bacterium]